MSLSNSKIAVPRFVFVIPRFGEGIAGGVETLVGFLARELVARGEQVEVWTTCARDNRSWANEYPPGEAIEFGVVTRRFPVDSRDLEKWIPLQIQLSEGMCLSIEEQLTWFEHSVNSRALYGAIANARPEIEAFFFAPYLFGTTFWGSQIAGDRAFLIPCLHDECYAYLDVVASMFRRVGGALFNCEPEGALAQELYGAVAGGAVGMGFVPPSLTVVQNTKPYFKEQFPYLLYLGRKETGKGVSELIDSFIEIKESSNVLQDLRLVIAGGGEFKDLFRPEALKRSDIIDCVQVSEEDKFSLLRHAVALAQPSLNESFSIVLMESWQYETPVIVNAGCAVTQYHAMKSKGGLWYRSTLEFAKVVERLVLDRQLCRTLGQSGRSYIENEYNWAAVLSRFDGVVKALLERRGQRSVPSASETTKLGDHRG